jgi:hypothetical protein
MRAPCNAKPSAMAEAGSLPAADAGSYAAASSQSRQEILGAPARQREPN